MGVGKKYLDESSLRIAIHRCFRRNATGFISDGSLPEGSCKPPVDDSEWRVD